MLLAIICIYVYTTSKSSILIRVVPTVIVAVTDPAMEDAPAVGTPEPVTKTCHGSCNRKGRVIL